MTRTSLRCLISLWLVGVTMSDSTPAASPSAHADLICHTENAVDCYPKIFQPTKDFQTIHDDQDIPPGLHVRMDIYAGTKEARLNIPMEGEEGYENLPIESTVIVVPQTELIKHAEDSEPALRDRVPQKPPVYEAAGKIIPPKPDGEGGDSEAFSRATQSLNGNYIHDPTYNQKIGEALDSLQDISHDIYYGVELAKKSNVIQQLMNIMSEVSEDPNMSLRRYQAAAIIGHSVQNNPTALKEISTSWKRLLPPTCGPKSVNSLGKSICEPEDLIRTLLRSLSRENHPVASKSKVYALSGLAKDREMRDAFLASNGMAQLLKIFTTGGDDWEGTRVNIAQFVMDTFLDENMGAQIGIWPQEPEIAEKYCELDEYATRDGCWEFQLTVMGARDRDAAEWKKEFLRLMGNARSGKREEVPEKEL